MITQKVEQFKRIIESMSPLLNNEPDLVCKPDPELQVCAVYRVEDGRRVSTRILVTFGAIRRAKSLETLAGRICRRLKKRA